MIGDARNEITAHNQVRVQIEAVENVYQETTEYGIIGDRTAEGAAMHEAKTGQPVEGKWHGGKCRDYARNLATVIDNLRRQKAALPATVHATIDQAVTRANDRRTKLQGGADVWDKRHELYPSVWNENGDRRNP